MRLTDIGAMAMGGVAARLRRDATGYAVCAVCALTAIVLMVWASVLALEPSAGAVYARLIVGGVFAAIAIAIVIALRLAHQPRQPATAGLHADTAAARSAQFAQLAMIVEAVMLGYALSRRSDR